ncbi:MAG: hypothetical protein ACRC35_09360 [Angustibacter sp.]
MATIKATCPCCGDVELTAAQVRLVVCNVAEWSYYAFTCDRCQDEIRKPAGVEVVSLLRSGGVTAERWTVPAEALEQHDGPVIGYDDVLDFALWLQRCVDPLAAVEAMGPGVRVAK